MSSSIYILKHTRSKILSLNSRKVIFILFPFCSKKIAFWKQNINFSRFVDSENMQGLLLYTVAGSEGSYGGIITQSDPPPFNKILESALFQSQDCASDPVCYHSDGQEIGGMNTIAEQ